MNAMSAYRDGVKQLNRDKQMTIKTEYLDQFNPMRRAKVEAALDRQMRLDGRYMFRWQVAELLAADAPRVDSAKGRLYHGPNGYFYDVSSLTQTCVDYVMWLANR